MHLCVFEDDMLTQKAKAANMCEIAWSEVLSQIPEFHFLPERQVPRPRQWRAIKGKNGERSLWATSGVGISYKAVDLASGLVTCPLMALCHGMVTSSSSLKVTQQLTEASKELELELSSALNELPSQRLFTFEYI